MAEHICELDKRLKGSLQETEDWWNLFKDDKGELYVEHTWSHTKLKTLTTDAGEEKVDVQTFLGGDNPQAAGARAALEKYLES